jgi:anti-anti-sigma regulatory factor
MRSAFFYTAQDRQPALLPSMPTIAIDLDARNASQWISSLAHQAPEPSPHLVVDCASLKCLRTLGVSHVISQLLVLHKSGAIVWLRNVDPLLHRCLHLLRLHTMFHIL